MKFLAMPIMNELVCVATWIAVLWWGRYDLNYLHISLKNYDSTQKQIYFTYRMYNV